MIYLFNEFSCELPDAIISENVLIRLSFHGPQEHPPYQIIINQDRLLKGETLKQSFERQRAQFKRDYKIDVIREGGILIGSDKIEGFEMESSVIQNKKHNFQLQAMLLTNEQNVSVITLCADEPLMKFHRQKWNETLNSFKLRKA